MGSRSTASLAGFTSAHALGMAEVCHSRQASGLKARPLLEYNPCAGLGSLLK